MKVVPVVELTSVELKYLPQGEEIASALAMEYAGSECPLVTREKVEFFAGGVPFALDFEHLTITNLLTKERDCFVFEDGSIYFKPFRLNVE